MKEKLIERTVRTAKPEAKPYEIRDTDLKGLLLRVQPSGAKSFIVEWKRGQRRTLGRYPVMTLEGARRAARAALVEADTHGAPLATINKRATKPGTFGEFMREHYAPHVEATAKAGKFTTALIEKHFGYLYDEPLTAITRAEFDRFKAKRLKAGTNPATVNRDLDRIKAALSKAVEWELLEANPLLGVKRIKREIEERVRYLSPEEEKALRATLELREARFRQRRLSGIAWRKERGREPLKPITGYADHIMPMTLLALNTGMRRGEITQLTWADVDLKAKRVTVRAGYAKSGKARHIPLNSEAVAVLKQWKKQQPVGRLFNLICTAKAWGRLMEKAKLDDFRFHDLRHTFASKLVMAGVDLNTVRELLGHGDIKMTLRYAHLAPEHKAAAVEMLVR
ncbi:site-specific integrase [Frateuria soli]|uniref:site-specific integrase n=1 Tax=Frateuria soli TaxID=1542730 RepID=UPI001E2942D2|nr:site-specific integrase [Frateuria soli]UGB39115.1 site-specific integrase [Frateuria soli]